MDNLTGILYKALTAHLGLIVGTNDPRGLRAKLCARRRELNDNTLSVLAFKTSPLRPRNELWILNGAVSGVPETEPQTLKEEDNDGETSEVGTRTYPSL